VVVPDVDYVVDLDTGAMTPLPAAIVGGTNDANDFAVSPDGSRLAYSRPADDGTTQVFVANFDGTEIQQITNAAEAIGPDWSPDGTRLAYSARAEATDFLNIVVLDLATGETTQVTFEEADAVGARFSPDGSSIVYDVARPLRQWGVRIVPATGGRSTLLVGAGGPGEAGDGSLSPNGSVLAFGWSEGSQGDGTDIGIANADGSDPRTLVPGAPGYLLDPNWSPDGTRIAYFDDGFREVYVVDVATGTTTLVAEGAVPAWIDDHTLIVELDSGL
jgi:TolB protein